FFGGTKDEHVKDGNGGDTLKFGGGNDIYTAKGSSGSDGHDIIDGGAGSDTYDAGLAGAALSINLDSIGHDFSAMFAGSVALAANTATSTGIEIGLDTITGFENVSGGSASDLIYGSGAANGISGGDNNDS